MFPSLVLGRLKVRSPTSSTTRSFFADSRSNQADWLTAGAAIVGIIGIGFGLWWADAAAAIVISLKTAQFHNSQKFLRESVGDLMDESPKTPDESEPHPLIDRVRREVAGTAWIAEAAVALRENGHLITGEVWVVRAEGRGRAGLRAALAAPRRAGLAPARDRSRPARVAQRSSRRTSGLGLRTSPILPGETGYKHE